MNGTTNGGRRGIRVDQVGDPFANLPADASAGSTGSTRPRSPLRPTGSYGSTGRALFRLPGVNQWDITLVEELAHQQGHAAPVPRRLHQRLQPHPARPERHPERLRRERQRPDLRGGGELVRSDHGHPQPARDPARPAVHLELRDPMHARATLLLDHVFVLCAEGAPEAEALTRLGFREGSGNTHPGQGTACRRFFFEHLYLELLWVHDAAEARSAVSLPTRLFERWSLRHIPRFPVRRHPEKRRPRSRGAALPHLALSPLVPSRGARHRRGRGYAALRARALLLSATAAARGPCARAPDAHPGAPRGGGGHHRHPGARPADRGPARGRGRGPRVLSARGASTSWRSISGRSPGGTRPIFGLACPSSCVTDRPRPLFKGRAPGRVQAPLRGAARPRGRRLHARDGRPPGRRWAAPPSRSPRARPCSASPSG